MNTKIGNKASIQNPALLPFKSLIGKWKTTGSHPYLPGIILHGYTTFDWIEHGAFLMTRSEIDEPHFPHGIGIFGSDDIAKSFYLFTFDERGISRKYDVAIEGNTIQWWRNDPNFSQRFSLTIDSDNHMSSTGEMSKDGRDWEKDLSLSYERLA